mmetsp:Transcript_113457/g.270291  ORF Transcript_113457/g.270291 Transcript_113457/m.270291 type:complete len:97 (-) Transcript_113457:8-298(-)|eukprot:CAMPEP_0181473384 /NCGR_PEP_ID=MMETSP1110-20121109/40094_1 /TAXON_ID=174948 /ORGANISM="Symbiodinium sp., Strain CCMP421" /LENGTH=96 /DNA_ID=CAMNT_0023598495 /DNA_START=72 /DNA_END=362 /DNA_ORIENTATION=+
MLGALAIFALIPLAALGVKALQQLNERCASSTPAGSKDEMETSWKDLEAAYPWVRFARQRKYLGENLEDARAWIQLQLRLDRLAQESLEAHDTNEG